MQIQRILLSLIRREQPKFLGRWNLEDCINKRNSKVDWANEDHCGTCSITIKTDTKNTDQAIIPSTKKIKRT